MKSITVDDQIYNKFKNLAKEKGTTLVQMMRAELPAVLDKAKTMEYPKIMKSKEIKQQIIETVLPKCINEVAVEKSPRRALMDMIQTLAELDPDAPENQSTLTETFKQIGEKVENYQWAAFHLNNERESLQKQKDHYDALIKRCDKIEERMREYIRNVLDVLGRKELRGENGSRIYISSYPAVEVYNPELLPDCYKQEKKSISVNKTKIGEDLTHGIKVEGAKLVNNIYGSISRPKKALK